MVRTRQPGQAAFKAILPEDIDWKPFPAFPPSVRLAVVVGQPSEPGPYTIRVKVPSGVKLMPHKHPEDRVYRSAIFYTSDEQKRIAEATIADVEASGLWPGKVLTEVSPAGAFWEAEPEHQDYLERVPHGYTCHFIRPDWKLPTGEEGKRGARAAE